MDTTNVKMTIGASIILKSMIDVILTKEDEVAGQKIRVSRNLPFRLSYRLNKNLLIFEKDIKAFEFEKTKLLAQYGELNEDGTQVEIKDEEKLKEYNENIQKLLGFHVTHEIVKLEPEDLERIEDEDISFSSDAMKLFIGYMTNDPGLLKEIETRLNFEEVITNEEQSNE